jgi:lysophospholipase L1-like esterase
VGRALKVRHRGGGDPFLDRLNALAEKDVSDLPPKNGVEFAGSSMFEGWTEVTAHMAPIPAFNRSIGGSKTADILSHLDQLVLQYEPEVVVLYTGINDVSEGIAPKTAAENIRKIINGIQTALPETHVIYIPALNTGNRPDSESRITDVNRRVNAYAEEDGDVTVLDVGPALVDGNGNTRPELLLDGGTHYNETAYKIMAGVVKPVVEPLYTPQK